MSKWDLWQIYSSEKSNSKISLVVDNIATNQNAAPTTSTMHHYLTLSLILCVTVWDGAFAFYAGPIAPTTSLSSIGSSSTDVVQPSSNVFAVSNSVRRNLVVLQEGKVNDGTERGIPILALTLLGCVWLFTIPPEFRRAFICPSEICVENRDKCNDCRTLSEWKDGVKEYYDSGGGIVWDFSIAPK